jgi:hypothetical protein
MHVKTQGMFLKLLLLTIGLVTLALIGLSISMLLKKGGKFPSSSVGKNQAMRERGITCVRHNELKCYREAKERELCACDA